MYALAVSFPTVAVSTIYCLWFAYHQARLRQAQREQLLRERVALLLWAAANVADGPEKPRLADPSQPTPLFQRRCPLARPALRLRRHRRR
jgi:hypothetical protein